MRQLRFGWKKAGLLSWVYLFGWLLYPVAIASLLHPSDVLGFQYWIQGLAVPGYYSMQSLVVGELVAVVSLATLTFGEFVVMVLLCRRLGYALTLWPVAAALVALLGNAAWFLLKNYYAPEGLLLGFTPVVLTVGVEAICARMGAGFTFGAGRHAGVEYGR
jgi:hypothetical protein